MLGRRDAPTAVNIFRRYAVLAAAVAATLGGAASTEVTLGVDGGYSNVVVKISDGLQEHKCSGLIFKLKVRRDVVKFIKLLSMQDELQAVFCLQSA